MATHDESEIDGLADAIVDSIRGVDSRDGIGGRTRARATETRADSSVTRVGE
jgi:hypothetical protein